MKTQSKIKMAGEVIQVLVDHNTDDWGYYDHDRRLIYISQRAIDYDQYAETLRHEMMHAALRIGGVAFNETMEEEALIRCLETIFFPAWNAIQPAMS